MYNRLVEQANALPEAPAGSSNQHIKLRRQDARNRALCELAPNGNLSCLLASADPTTALQTHSLFEKGGNIGEFLIISDLCGNLNGHCGFRFQKNSYPFFSLKCLCTCFFRTEVHSINCKDSICLPRKSQC